jgi:hypothetical protein
VLKELYEADSSADLDEIGGPIYWPDLTFLEAFAERFGSARPHWYRHPRSRRSLGGAS